MLDKKLMAPWIRRFLLEHIVGELNLARNTQASYRDAMTLLLPFIAARTGRAIDRLAVQELSSDLIRLFLEHLEKERHCSIATRNQRLAAIHALARFIGTRSVEDLGWCAEILAVPFKKGPKGTLPYLEKPEMDALLSVPDRRSERGSREYALLLFLYNSGARADEAARLSTGDLFLASSPAVKITGKGNKTRVCPLWPATASLLGALIAAKQPKDRVFLNRNNQAFTRFGIYALVKRCAGKAAERIKSLSPKRVSPHVIRHTTAVHLLRAGVDINTIRAWLGHVSLDTTNIYAEVDLEMKAKALGACEVQEGSRNRSWHQQAGLMAFLKGLQVSVKGGAALPTITSSRRGDSPKEIA
ncbi:MAG: tyrosine-type recombinase/integrase [Elusimicrobia bacterium]|nr:tyrosine-type recombinase/integrase [Elusimicrobiota bacterium]MDE2424432.1 tyrosine-type recombinase/integrase [Elusimicrobiota bacterium]